MQRNNKQIKFAEIHDHFSIRKLSVGACSVLLAATLWGVNSAAPVKADVNTDSNQVSKVEENEPKENAQEEQTKTGQEGNQDSQSLQVDSKSLTADQNSIKEAISENKAKVPDQQESDFQKIQEALNQFKSVTIKQTITYHKPGVAESSTTHEVTFVVTSAFVHQIDQGANANSNVDLKYWAKPDVGQPKWLIDKQIKHSSDVNSIIDQINHFKDGFPKATYDFLSQNIDQIPGYTSSYTVQDDKAGAKASDPVSATSIPKWTVNNSSISRIYNITYQQIVQPTSPAQPTAPTSPTAPSQVSQVSQPSQVVAPHPQTQGSTVKPHASKTPTKPKAAKTAKRANKARRSVVGVATHATQNRRGLAAPAPSQLKNAVSANAASPKRTSVTAAAQKQNKTLPQTGENHSSLKMLGLLGLTAAGLGLILALAADRRRL